jgi:translation initiation factor IF-2
MGHVDHGKTTLLDTIRKTNVVEGEFGGITQHIGAYQVEIEHNGEKRKITFLDTPGHEAFTEMRARGARVTDIVVLVVAADDGIMPQTVEAINHAQAAEVPIIVAINKMDRPDANPDRVKQQLTEHNLVVEDYGGDVIAVPVSAKTGEGVNDLLEYILLVADLHELKADPSGHATGTIVEAKVEAGRGPVATVLVQSGTLRVGDSLVAGLAYGKVRAMTNDRGERLLKAPPATPVEVLGLNAAPNAGDTVEVVKNDKEARATAERRQLRQRMARLSSGTARITLDELYRRAQEGVIKDMNLIVKADVQGSVEAVIGQLNKLEENKSDDEVRLSIKHSGVGAISEADINLASATNAIVIGFNVRADAAAQRAAERDGVDIRLYNIIYNLVEDIEKAMKGLLTPVYEEVALGKAEVRQVFRTPRGVFIAGCYVTEGKIVRNAEMRVRRGREVLFTGKIDSLRHIKDDVREMAQGFECGITIQDWNDYQVGDVLECFEMKQVAR